MGTPDFAVPALNSLVDSEHEVIAVYTQPDKPSGRGQDLVYSPVKRKALSCGLPVLQPQSLRSKEEEENLVKLCPEIIVVAAYGLMLPRGILDTPSFGCINIHPSLLPRHRGPSPVAAAILAGDEITGVSMMLMDEGMDTGPILAQERVSLSPQDTTGLLTADLSRIGAQLLMRTLPLWFQGHLKPNPQDNREATYSRIINKKDGEIDWRRSATELSRKVRAFQPWPGCFTFWQGKMLKVIGSVPLHGQGGEPGRVVIINRTQGTDVGVQTGDGILGLRQIQLQGKRSMAAADFVRGQKGFIGALLPS